MFFVKSCMFLNDMMVKLLTSFSRTISPTMYSGFRPPAALVTTTPDKLLGTEPCARRVVKVGNN